MASPRWGLHSAAAGGELHVFGGRTKNFVEEKREVTVSVHSVNQCSKTWQTRATTGQHPTGLYLGACTSSGRYLYQYGGTDGSSFCSSLHQLDVDSLEWSQLSSGPTSMLGCGIVFYKNKLFLFGGYGYSTHPGPEFIRSWEYSSRGWSNELHCFDLQEGECLARKMF